MDAASAPCPQPQQQKSSSSASLTSSSSSDSSSSDAPEHGECAGDSPKTLELASDSDLDSEDQDLCLYFYLCFVGGPLSICFVLRQGAMGMGEQSICFFMSYPGSYIDPEHVLGSGWYSCWA